MNSLVALDNLLLDFGLEHLDRCFVAVVNVPWKLTTRLTLGAMEYVPLLEVCAPCTSK